MTELETVTEDARKTRKGYNLQPTAAQKQRKQRQRQQPSHYVTTLLSQGPRPPPYTLIVKPGVEQALSTIQPFEYTNFISRWV